MFNHFDAALVGFFAGFAGVVKAVILLVIAYLCAKAGSKFATSMTNRFIKEEKFKAIPPYVGNIVYLAIILFFLPGICEALGAKSIATPIIGMMNTLWGFLPNLIGAGIILTVGKMIANLAKELVVPLLERLDTWQAKCCENPSVKLSKSIGTIVYVLILVPVIISSLEVLKLGSMTRPAVHMLEEVLTYIPLLAGSVLLSFLGIVIGKLAGNVVRSLVGATGIDAKVSSLIGREHFQLSHIAGSIVHVLLVIFFAVEALSVLRLHILTKIGMSLVAYLPNVIAAVVIVLGAYMLTGILQKMFPYKKPVAIFVYALAAVMILSQLQIASAIVNASFLILMTGIALAIAIGVGVGSIDVCRDCFKHLRDKRCRRFYSDEDVPEHKETVDDSLQS